MQSMQRSFGRILRKAPGDNAKVAVLLSDYEDADKVLAKIIDQAKSWRESWINIASAQLGIITEYDGLYDPIVGATDGHGRPAAPTPEAQLERTLRLKEVYSELKTEVFEEVATIETGIIKPATDARDCIAPMRKTIKKRENKRLDYEKCQDKANKLQRKPSKTAKEDAALVKAEAEVTRTAEDFTAADSHLRETLPPLIEATFSIIPPLISSVVMIQNRLLGLYYTTLHNYCADFNFPSPPPPMEDVIALWSAGYDPAKRQVEMISIVATGKGVRQPMRLPANEPSTGQDRRDSVSSTASSVPEPGARRTPSGLIPSGGPPINSPRPNRIPSTTSLVSQASPGIQQRATFNGSNIVPTDFTTASRLGQGISPAALTPNLVSNNNPRSDYFGRPSNATPIATPAYNSPAINPAGRTVSSSSLAVKKKPPPPPPKRIASMKPEEFVVAQYTFTGQGAGDLSFREGDRIRIVKKTDTDQDWWVGELGGVKGSFPANYCKAT